MHTTQVDTAQGLTDTSARTILVVDDEPQIREVVQACLEVTRGWQVVLAADGQEGLLQAKAAQPDLILLDVRMPKMDGLTFLQKLRADQTIAAIPVILLTAEVQLLTSERLAELGLAQVIAKPFNPLILSDQIATALGWKL